MAKTIQSYYAAFYRGGSFHCIQEGKRYSLTRIEGKLSTLYPKIGEFRIINHDFADGVWRVRWKVSAK